VQKCRFSILAGETREMKWELGGWVIRRGEGGDGRLGGPLWTQSGGLCGPWVGSGRVFQV